MARVRVGNWSRKFAVTALAIMVAATGCRELPFRRLGPALAEGYPSAVAGESADATTNEAGARAEVEHPLPRLPLEPVAEAVGPAPILAAEPTEPPEPPPPVEPALTAPIDPNISLPASEGEPGSDVAPSALDVEATVPAAPDYGQDGGHDAVAQPESDVEFCPVDAWDDGLRRLRELAKSQAARGDAMAPTWDLRERLLTCLAESDARGEPAAVWQTVLTALGEPKPPALEVVELTFARRVRGFGDFEAVERAEFRAGQPVLLYCELTGLRYLPDGERHRSRLSTVVEVSSESSDAPVWSQALGTADDLCRRPRHDYYVNGRLVLPDSLGPGPYRLRLTHTDVSDGRSAARSIGFRILPADEVR